ncbi:hypothetical protein IP68_12525 [Blastomonas sp. AAP25]|uniref:hypothetical protein n=1 Tax=Blastomonas sp. AAP25 TaxID=1523416 RepID=UPI0006B9E21E|nr:hypothetical protein [Blastomonas sp. AAP25]KPF74578.1 hypothetical protein IP68_12525 [Blastomonas sp. AAP25]
MGKLIASGVGDMLDVATGFFGKIKIYLIIAGVCLACVNLAYCRGHSAGVNSERAAWQAKSAAIIAARVKAALLAEKRDAVIKAQGQDIIDRRKELDSATADIPDQGLSARQRARADSERLRAGR